MSRFCTSCGAAVADTTNFCPQCGTPAPAPAQPAPGQPQPIQPPYAGQPYMGQPPYGQPPYNTPGQPAYYAVRPARPGRGFGIAAMVLGIIGVVYSFILFMGVISMASTFRYSSYVAGTLAAGSLVYSVFGILALIFGVVSRNRGYRCGVSFSGVILGSISIGLCVLSALIAAVA